MTHAKHTPFLVRLYHRFRSRKAPLKPAEMSDAEVLTALLGSPESAHALLEECGGKLENFMTIRSFAPLYENPYAKIGRAKYALLECLREFVGRVS
jgi:hypothetical protein